MIKLFITVGTTPFDSLIRYCDENINLSKFEVIAQVSELASYTVQNIKGITFTKDINTYYNDADIVITHAGAGSTYNLLEMNKKVILVPNNTLKDGHQNDICKFIKDHNYGEVLSLENNIIDLNVILLSVHGNLYMQYKNETGKGIAKEILRHSFKK